MKPWDPPEERLYPVLSDLLDDWQASYRPAFEGVRVIGHRWSPQAHAMKDFLARNQLPYQWLDVESDPAALQYLGAAGADPAVLPVVIFPDGSHLVQPAAQQVAEKVGLRTRAQAPFYDLVIVGSGPAGLAAGVYGASEGLRTLIIEREAPGGQAGQSSRIENYLGFPVGLSGLDLARRAVAQATRFGTEILTPQEVAAVRLNDHYKVLTLADGAEVSCHALLVATGVQYRKLDAPGVEALTGAGIYYGAAVTEAISTRGQDVFVIGGGNSAGQAAMYLSSFARSVTILARGHGLAESMSQYLIGQLNATPNISVRTRASVTAAQGRGNLEALTITDADSGASETVQAAALFIFIGALPRTDWLGDLVERDKAGFIPTGPDLLRDGKRPRGWNLGRDPYWLESSVPGIFAAGDVRARSVKRIASAVGEGSMAVQFVHQYLGSL
jgi:thioredoxin reductase (NADPH)